jgi:hypothetical protein
LGFLSNLFGGGKQVESTATVEPVEYKNYFIYPFAIAESGQYRVAGKIVSSELFDGETKEHRFIRSDVLMSRADADELMVKKAKMLIDQMGNKIFS